MEKPILFSTPMVQAILQGRKTMTRRIIKPQPKVPLLCVIEHECEGRACWMEEGANQLSKGFRLFKSFEVGDILWVRETFTILEPEHCMAGMDSRFVYKADSNLDTEEIRKEYVRIGYPYKWKPLIFMPKIASRILLQVKSVKMERLQDITEKDALAEGVEARKEKGQLIYKDYYGKLHKGNGYLHPSNSFLSLWDKINGKKQLPSNPWVWVIEFEKINRCQENH
jgi:hypothetical protein